MGTAVAGGKKTRSPRPLPLPPLGHWVEKNPWDCQVRGPTFGFEVFSFSRGEQKNGPSGKKFVFQPQKPEPANSSIPFFFFTPPVCQGSREVKKENRAWGVEYRVTASCARAHGGEILLPPQKKQKTTGAGKGPAGGKPSIRVPLARRFPNRAFKEGGSAAGDRESIQGWEPFPSLEASISLPHSPESEGVGALPGGIGGGGPTCAPHPPEHV